MIAALIRSLGIATKLSIGLYLYVMYFISFNKYDDEFATKVFEGTQVIIAAAILILLFATKHTHKLSAAIFLVISKGISASLAKYFQDFYEIRVTDIYPSLSYIYDNEINKIGQYKHFETINFIATLLLFLASVAISYYLLTTKNLVKFRTPNRQRRGFAYFAAETALAIMVIVIFMTESVINHRIITSTHYSNWLSLPSPSLIAYAGTAAIVILFGNSQATKLRGAILLASILIAHILITYLHDTYAWCGYYWPNNLIGICFPFTIWPANLLGFTHYQTEIYALLLFSLIAVFSLVELILHRRKDLVESSNNSFQG